ncbi:hypothetical protein [Bradyrhizobium elkanii]|uniref:hypothetical protein n=1 Tax=Bradyrhizobium elkanii TaxID=29448 RepID=UPI00209FA5C2|nr:hypothetical protein [Bradyrhizobium elkanii]MCS4110022.1 hypothetical protein [Bradyrhizobium elkanii]
MRQLADVRDNFPEERIAIAGRESCRPTQRKHIEKLARSHSTKWIALVDAIFYIDLFFYIDAD